MDRGLHRRETDHAGTGRHGNTGDSLPYAPKWSTASGWRIHVAGIRQNTRASSAPPGRYVGTRSTDFGSDVDRIDCR